MEPCLPVLIAVTPRAGRLNHVNLRPLAPLPRGFEPGAYLGAAAFAPVGPDYLAAVRGVEQAGTTRHGREVLVLAGVRVPDEPERGRVLAWLGDKLDALGAGVTRIDWSAHDGSDYPLADLDDWCREARATFALEPAAAAAGGTRGLRRPRSAVGGVVAAAVVVGFLGLGIAASRPAARGGAGSSRTPPTTAGPTANPHRPVAKADEPWEKFVIDILREVDPAMRRRKEIALVDRMWQVLDGVEGHKLSGFDQKGENDRVVALKAHNPFKKWLEDHYAGRQNNPRASIGAVENKEIESLENVGGSLGSPRDVMVTTERLERLASALKITEGTPRDPLPFLTPDTVRRYDSVVAIFDDHCRHVRALANLSRSNPDQPAATPMSPGPSRSRPGRRSDPDQPAAATPTLNEYRDKLREDCAAAKAQIERLERALAVYDEPRPPRAAKEDAEK